jgi:hypothetical protein
MVNLRKEGGGPSKKTAPRCEEHCAHSQRLYEGLLDLYFARISLKSSKLTASSTVLTRFSTCLQKVACPVFDWNLWLKVKSLVSQTAQ